MAKLGLPTSFGSIVMKTEINDPTAGQSACINTKPDWPVAECDLHNSFGNNVHLEENSINTNDWICSNCQLANHSMKRSCSTCNYPKSNLLPKQSKESRILV